MDSFYDVPRRAPVPTQVEKFCGAPVVPEVSMLCPQRPTVDSIPSYNTWKMNQTTHNTDVLTSNKQNIMKGSHNFNHSRPFSSPQNSSQFLKKHVRFETPILQHRPSATYEQFNSRRVNSQRYGITPDFLNDIPQVHKKEDLPVKQTAPLTRQTFKEMYMANVPNRHLDLSLIDPPNTPKIAEKPSVIPEEDELEAISNAEIVPEIQKNKENEMPKTYREFLETQKKVTKEGKVNLNDSVTDIFNYKRGKVGNNNCEDPLESGDVLIKCPSKLRSTVSDFHMDLKDDAHAETFVRYLPDYERTIDAGVKRSKSPVYIKYLPSYEYSQNKFKPDHLQKLKNPSPTSDGETQTTLDYVMPETESPRKAKEDSEPSNKKLLQIIACQNEQLLMLQKQVAILLNSQHQKQPRQISSAPHRLNYRNEKCVTSTQNENFLSPNITPRKRGLSKFSFDLMTSFEVAIKQHNKQNRNYEPKIQEVTELDSVTTENTSTVDKNDKTVVDTSLHLQEPLKVSEMCPSPEPSININMNDYDSSEEEMWSSDIGATFYDNLMGQVNNILRKAQAQAKEDLATIEGRKNVATSVKDKTMSRVKEATLKHLRNIGVTIGPIGDSDNSFSSESDGKDYSPAEVSFAVKQLLMKYLPDEQLAKISHKQARSAPTARGDCPGIINARPEFSFASVQYMRKYNLIPPNNERKPREGEHVLKSPQPQKLEGPKILDITALKLQPKLL